MTRKRELEQYILHSILSMVLLIVCAQNAVQAKSPECDSAVNRIYLIATTDVRQNSDSLSTIIELADYVRSCKEKPSIEFQIWLLTTEVFAFEGLGEYEEASRIVEVFFVEYFDTATDFYKAQFYLWRLHLNAISGKAIQMVIDYNEAKKYATALDSTNRAHLHVNGAHGYMQVNENETARKLTEEALRFVPSPKNYEDSLAIARAKLIGAEAKLRISEDYDDVKAELREAFELFVALGDTSKASLTQLVLGMTYTAEGDTTAALEEMARGVALARQAGSVRSEIYALYRRGQLLREAGRLDEAEATLQEALEASSTLGEFRLRLMYETARLYEQREDFERANTLYQRVVDAPKPNSFLDELEAERLAQDGMIRILLIEQSQARNRYYLALAGILAVAVIGGVLFWRIRQSRRAFDARLGGAVVIPERIPTGISLAELERSFQQHVGSDLLGTRLAHLYAVLFDPELVLPFIHDGFLARQVKGDFIENNTALFMCAASVEEAIEQREFRNNPANTLGAYLRSEFRKRDWEWPKNPIAWKQYFWDEHMERLR